MDELYLDNIDEYVNDQDKIVSVFYVREVLLYFLDVMRVDVPTTCGR